MPVSAVDIISPAFQHTKKQLFQPFRFGQWLRLALLGLATGELGSGGSCNFNAPSGSHRQTPSDQFLPSFSNLPGLGHFSLPELVALISLAVLLAFVLIVLFVYLNSVCRFILFESILNKNCVFRGSWTRWRPTGRRFFVWQILVQIVVMIGLVILIGIPLWFAYVSGWLKQPNLHLAPLALGGILLFLVLVAFCVLALIVQVLAKDFLVPLMALDDLGWQEAWERLLAMMKSEKGGYAGYLGMKILLAIAAGIVIAIASIVLILVLALPVGLMIGVIAVTAKLTWNVYTITLAVIGGIIALALVLFLLAMISVPAVVFFPAYSIYFFAARYPALSARLYPVPAPPLVSPPPPPIPPPLPLGPEPIG